MGAHLGEGPSEAERWEDSKVLSSSLVDVGAKERAVHQLRAQGLSAQEQAQVNVSPHLLSLPHQCFLLRSKAPSYLSTYICFFVLFCFCFKQSNGSSLGSCHDSLILWPPNFLHIIRFLYTDDCYLSKVRSYLIIKCAEGFQI